MGGGQESQTARTASLGLITWRDVEEPIKTERPKNDDITLVVRSILS